MPYFFSVCKKLNIDIGQIWHYDFYKKHYETLSQERIYIMRLRPDNTIAICIDFQEKLMPTITDADKVLDRAAMLVKGLRILGVPVMVTQQYTKGLGGTVEPVHSALGDYEPYEKGSFGAYDEPEFKAVIDAYGRKNIILFGTETHICVLQTALGLKYAGYNAMLIEDCCGSRKAQDKENGIRRAMGEGIMISGAESVLFELTVVSGTPGFKQISKLVK